MEGSSGTTAAAGKFLIEYGTPGWSGSFHLDASTNEIDSRMWSICNQLLPKTIKESHPANTSVTWIKVYRLEKQQERRSNNLNELLSEPERRVSEIAQNLPIKRQYALKREEGAYNLFDPGSLAKSSDEK